MRRTSVVAAMTAGASLLSGPAWAHPGFSPADVPAGEAVELTLAMAHGCEDAEPTTEGPPASATTLVAVRVPDAVTDVEPAEKPGWALTVEQDDTGRVTEFEWSLEDETQAVEAPDFRLSATPFGTTGEQIDWLVYQECPGGSYQWIGTTGDPEADPAVRMVLTTTASPPPEPSPAPVPTLEPTETATTASPAPTAVATGSDDEQADAGAGVPPWAVVLAVAAVAGIAALGLRRRSAR